MYDVNASVILYQFRINRDQDYLSVIFNADDAKKKNIYE